MRQRNGRKADSGVRVPLDAGFTLMEMVVAVFVVSVMTAVLTPHLLGASERAQAAACEQNQRTIRAALTEYYMLHNAYPQGDTQTQLETLKDDKLIESIPSDPGGGTYQIEDADPTHVQVSCSKHLTLPADQ